MQSNFYKSLLGLGALCLASTVWADGKLVSVTPNKVGGGVLVSIKGEDLGQPKVLRVNGNRSYILQFDASLSGKARRTSIGDAGVRYVQVGWFTNRPPRVRVHFRVDADTNPTLNRTEDGWEVGFGVERESAPKAPVSSTFPDRVPPLDSRPVAMSAGNQPPTTIVEAAMSPRVSLDFVATDVVQILKALAMQANVNIVTSPDVSGKITVSLNNVSVTDALDIVTAMASVRYTKIGNTYVVTSSGRFSETIQQISGKADVATETRVVPLFSRQGSQVKAALLKTNPVATLRGRYDLILSSDNISVTQSQTVTPTNNTGGAGGGAADGGGAQSGGQTQLNTATGSAEAKAEGDMYAVIVGTPGRLDEIERAVRDIDAKICEAMGIRVPDRAGVVQKTYEPKGIGAEDLLAAMKSDKTLDFSGVKMLATPRNSLSRQVVVVSGRSNDVEDVMALLASIDSLSDGGPAAYEVVGLRFVKPQVAMVGVVDAVPGIRAKLMPPPVDPMVGIKYVEEARSGQRPGDPQNNQAGGGAPGGDTGGQGGQGGQGGGSPTQAASQFRADVQTNQTPMRLLLRGTREQLDQAKRYLDMIDVEPKQVAIELRVMELSRDDALKVGLDLSALTGGSLQSLRFNNGLGGANEIGGMSGRVGFAGGGSISITGLLDSVTTRNNLIARPSILASDGVPTRIFVGDEVRYIQSIQSSQNGVSVTTGQVDVGVNFVVTPRVGADGNITLQLGPELSILQGFTPVPGGGQLPQTSKRTASSIVNIRSGETIAIGGLIQDQDRRTVGGVPILKDLPIIGRLFSRTDNRKVRSEVVFFVTVREVTRENRQATANPRQAERDNTTLPGHRP